MIKHINSFSEINTIKPETLLVLDIDDTVMSFPDISKKWWSETYHKFINENYNKENAYNKTNSLWIDYIIKSKPILNDEKNFLNLLEQISINKCDLIFLTARDNSLSELTVKQLNECNLNVNPMKIFYSKYKGNELEYIIKIIYPNIKNIIFVDDLLDNLKDVAYKFNNPKLFKYNLELYKIKHIY
jgi:hypothetical protein